MKDEIYNAHGFVGQLDHDTMPALALELWDEVLHHRLDRHSAQHLYLASVRRESREKSNGKVTAHFFPLTDSSS